MLAPSFSNCTFDKYKNNALTSQYCTYTQQLDGFDDFDKDFDSFKSLPFYIFGAFAIIATCMNAGSFYLFSKRREITAFTMQEVMPVAKEISKGIKEGLK